jgi:hypothetical protein
LLVVTEEIVTLAPLAAAVTVCFCVTPTITFPKFTVDGDTDN